MKREVIQKAETGTWPAMIWPVYGFKAGRREIVAECDDYYAAVDLVNASERNLYIAEPRRAA